MKTPGKRKINALLRKEIQEYRNSFVMTPLVVSGVLLFFIMVSVLLANRITAVGDSVVDILAEEHGGGGMNITIQIDDAGESQEFVVTDEQNGAAVEEDWNFSREWTFNPKRKDKPATEKHEHFQSLNPFLDALHGLFLVLLLITSCNYLLGTFHQDRFDRSILFWKSMPVSEWQEVATRMAVVCVLAPGIYVAVSIFTQVTSTALAMLTVWRMDMDPMQMVLGNIDFLTLFRGQLGGIMIWVLWSVPFYAWLLLSSTISRRSPLLLALAVPLALIVVEQLFLGSEYLSTAFSHHVPHPADESEGALGFYFREPRWMDLDIMGMLLGLLVSAGLLSGAVWFRKHRFES